MHIRHLTAQIVRLPLKRPFTHATATRQESENIFVRCELADGTVGWGEGVPRRLFIAILDRIERLARSPAKELERA